MEAFGAGVPRVAPPRGRGGEPRGGGCGGVGRGRLMGAIVLDAGPSQPGLHLYAQCLNNRPGGVALLAINLSRTDAKTLSLPIPAERYTLTAAKLEDAEVQ